MRHQFFNSSKSGFTLIEVLVVVMIIGVLSAIAAPSWLNFVNNQSLKVGQNKIQRAMQEAQNNATRDKITWQVSFKDDGVVKLAIHPANISPNLYWQNLDKNIRVVDRSIVSTDPNDTTLYFDRSNRLWRMQFNYKGHPNGQLGKITLSNRSGDQTKRCIIVSTLIGAMRSEQDQECSN